MELLTRLWKIIGFDHSPSSSSSSEAAEANQPIGPSPWENGSANNAPWSTTVKLDPTNTLVLTTKGRMAKELEKLNEEQLQRVKLDELQVIIKSQTSESVILRHKTHKPQRSVRKRCRKLVDKANECLEKKPDKIVNGKVIPGEPIKGKVKPGKLEEYQKLRADAHELAKTLRTRRVQPFNNKMHYERTVTLRVEQRAAFVAYGYLRGRRYSQIETDPRWKIHKDRPQPNWFKVRDLIMEHSVTWSKALDTLKRERLFNELKLWRGN